MGDPGSRYTHEEKLEALRTVSERVGHPTTVHEYREQRDDTMPTDQAIRDEFRDSDSPWLRALQEAGLEPDPARHNWSPTTDDALHAIATAASELVEWPSPDQYRDLGLLPSVETVYQLFDSWPDAVDAAKSEYERVARLVEDGPTHADELRAPGPGNPERQLIDRYKVGQETIYTLRGHDAPEPTGADAGGARSEYGAEDATDAIRRAASDRGEPLSMDEYRSWHRENPDTPSRKPILRLYDSWTDACEDAGVEHGVGPAAYSRDDMTDAVRRAAADRGEPLSFDEYESWAEQRPEPSASTVARRLGWTEAKKLAGVE